MICLNWLPGLSVCFKADRCVLEAPVHLRPYRGGLLSPVLSSHKAESSWRWIYCKVARPIKKQTVISSTNIPRGRSTICFLVSLCCLSLGLIRTADRVDLCLYVVFSYTIPDSLYTLRYTQPALPICDRSSRGPR